MSIHYSLQIKHRIDCKSLDPDRAVERETAQFVVAKETIWVSSVQKSQVKDIGFKTPVTAV